MSSSLPEAPDDCLPEMSMRCSFCLKNQLFASRNPSASTNYELVQISPMLSVHKLCLQSASGLKRRNNFDYSNEEIAREVQRCKEIHCDFCSKHGATVLCTEATCINSFHLSCFYLRSAPKKGKRSTAHAFCLTHILQDAGTKSSRVRKKGSRPSPRSKNVLHKSKPLLKNIASSPSTFEGCSSDTANCGEATASSKHCQVCRRLSSHTSRSSTSPKGKWACLKCGKWEKHKRNRRGNSKGCSKTSNEKSTPGEHKDICSTMKHSFCKEIDPHFERIKVKKRSDRSPLGIKQEEEKVSPHDHAAAFQLYGKENHTEKRPARKRVDTWILKEDGKSSKSKSDSSSSSTTKPTEKRKLPNIPKGCTVSASLESSPAKKFVENSQFDRTLTASTKTLPKAFGNVCDKKSSDLVTKDAAPNPRRLVKKINVEPIPLDQRQLYHVRTSLPIVFSESEAEEDYHWLVDGSDRQIDDFLDLNEGEKAFFKLWNTHLHKYPCLGDKMMTRILYRFIEEAGRSIVSQNLYRNFVLHLSNFYEFGIIDQETISELARLMRLQMSKPEVPDDGEAFFCDEVKPNTAILHMPQQQQRTISTPRKFPPLDLVSRCSTPLGDCESSVSSGLSVRLYLSESEEEEEEEETKEDQAINTSQMALRSANSPSQYKAPTGKMNVCYSVVKRKQKLPEQSLKMTLRRSGIAPSLSKGANVVFACDYKVDTISDLPALEDGLCGQATRIFSSTVAYRSWKSAAWGGRRSNGQRAGLQRTGDQRPNGRSGLKRKPALEAGDGGKQGPMAKLGRRTEGPRRQCSI